MIEDEFEVWVVTDACSSRTERNRDAAFDRLAGVMKARANLPNPIPVFLKIAPDLTEAELSDIAAATGKGEVDAVIISNTTLSRPPLLSRHKGEQGGLSGKPLFALSTRQLARFHQMTGGRSRDACRSGRATVRNGYAHIIFRKIG